MPGAIVRAPGGSEFGDCGMFTPAFGAGGDIVLPCEKAGETKPTGSSKDSKPEAKSVLRISGYPLSDRSIRA